MKAYRYLAFVPIEMESLARRRAQFGSLSIALDCVVTERPGYLLLAARPPIETSESGATGGAIVGELYRTGNRAPATGLTVREAQAINRSRGQHLIEAFWGNYIALLDEGSRPVEIIRAPFGDVPCFYCRTEDGWLVGSDLDLITRAGVPRPPIDREALALYLIAPDIRHAQTCLAGLRELAGGDRLSLGRESVIEPIWTPWTFVVPTRQCDDAPRAARHVAEAVCDAVAVAAQRYERPLVLLSGGLDSSIVAAALARTGRPFDALNMVTHAAAGDERDYARAVAAQVGIPLQEIMRDAAMIDVTWSAAADLPYPIERSFSQATRAAAEAIASATGAEVVLHGGGGDNIFCSLQSAAPLADLLRHRCWDKRAPTLLRDLAVMTNASSGAVAKQALARLLWRAPDFHWRADLTMLTPLGASYHAQAIEHPWLKPPRGASPGAAGHIALVLAALSIVQSPNILATLPWRAVLLSQPVIETCLSIPSWLWFERGCNRAVARHAFGAMLPEQVAWRPGKGALDSFVVEIFEHNRDRLRPMLLDGALAASGLIDRDAVAHVLDDPVPVRGQAFGRVMHFADVEAWARSWM